MLAEMVIGNAFNSLALVADSYHLATDLIGLAFQLFALQLTDSDRKVDEGRFPFGLDRVKVFVDLVTSVSLLSLCLVILLEATNKLYETEPVRLPPAATAVAAFGMLVNIFVMTKVGHDHDHDHDHDHESDVRNVVAHSLPHRCSRHRRRAIQVGSMSATRESPLTLIISTQLGLQGISAA